MQSHKFLTCLILHDTCLDRTETSAVQKQREERVRRLRDQQEDERRKKLEELRNQVCHNLKS